VQMMSGHLGVESTPGAGSKFWVEIPVGRADEKAIQAVSIDRGRVIRLAPDQPEYRILIVEDERDNWLLLRRLLEDVGFTVQVAENGLAGVEQFQAWRPHYIWMDVRMPTMDGLEATKRIRALEGGQEVIIVALSASVFKEQRDEVLAAGMNDFARKPFRFQEIYDCMARHLGVTFLYEQPPLQAADKLAEIPAKALSELPRELKDELIQALIGLNSPLIDELIERVTRLNPALGAILAQHAGRFGYTAMLKALQAADQG
jgi:CheY-like chemotaxis protein